MNIFKPLIIILNQNKIQLIFLSFLMLFVELALIRWAGSNVVYLSFFSNFLLLGSFLGIGIGFLRSSKHTTIFYLSPVILTFFVMFILKFPVIIDRNDKNILYFGIHAHSMFPAWLLLPILFLMVTAVMATIADGVARVFHQFKPLEAYRLDILGSILGTISFMLLSFLNVPPLGWAIIVSLIFMILLFPEWKNNKAITSIQIFFLMVLMGMLANESLDPHAYWSPYYKIQINKNYNDNNIYSVSTNNIPHQSIVPIEKRKIIEPFYFVPYENRNPHIPLNNVLIIGAGTGGDVAIALHEGAKHVDAIEIDPVLYQLGKKFNEDYPYNDPRVKVIINDGRAFLENNTAFYNLIIFALPDSLTLISGQSSLRLESYLFTIEAMQAMQKHLTPNGVFVMYNYYREKWLIDRFASTLNLIFHHSPCIDVFGGKNNNWLAVLMNSNHADALQCKTRWDSSKAEQIAPSTDNHPFIYLKKNTIPNLYLSTLFFILLVSIAFIRLAGVRYHSISHYADLFFMGAAFLLLETKNIINFALLFGTTWLVNALVFIGILSSVYLAIEVANRIKFSTSLLYFFLILSLLISWFIPGSVLLTFSLPSRFILATLLAFSPIFIANLIFAERFKNTHNATEAFGVNLMGAMLGGILEYTALIMGYQNLLILIALLYTVAIVLLYRLQRS